MTIKQNLAASKLVENGGNVSKSMIAAGYSKASAKNPQKLTRSKGWRKLIDEYLPDKLLLGLHKELLKSADQRIQLAAIDRAYKIKGRYNDNLPKNENDERT